MSNHQHINLIKSFREKRLNYSLNFASVICTLAILFFMSGGFTICSYAALTATTTKTIQGSSPHFIAEIEEAIEAGEPNFKYFGIRYKDTDYYIQSELQAAIMSGDYDPRSMTMGELHNIQKPTTGLLTLAALGIPIAEEIVNNDGDSLHSVPLTALTEDAVKIGWTYKKYSGGYAEDEKKVNPIYSHNLCESAKEDGTNYFLNVQGPISLKTAYGDPLHQAYPDQMVGLMMPPQHHFTIFPRVICGLLPFGVGGKKYINGRLEENYEDGFRAGELSLATGYFSQPIGKDNFPTTGANGLYFILTILGDNVRALNWSSLTSSGNVTATVTIEDKANKWSEPQQTQVKVTLTGPDILRGGDGTPVGSTAPAFSGPASITIKGHDNNGNTILSYPFTIRKWYINGTRKDAGDGFLAQQNWCRHLSGTDASPNYDVPYGFELINAKGVYPTDLPEGVIPANFPFSSTRASSSSHRIGGGLLAEWNTVYVDTPYNLNFKGNYFIDEKFTQSHFANSLPVVQTMFGGGKPTNYGVINKKTDLAQVICVSRL